MSSPEVGDASMQDQGKGGQAAAGTGAFGPNAWLVEDMYERYQTGPGLGVGLVAGVLRRLPPGGGHPSGLGHPACSGARRSCRLAARGRCVHPAPGRSGRRRSRRGGHPAPGARARIVSNMEASLGVPTATSVRVVPAKLLEVNRTIVNNQLRRTATRRKVQLHAPHRLRRRQGDWPLFRP